MWFDFYKLFTYSFTKDPLSRIKDKRQFTGAGVTQPDAMPDLRNADGFSAGAGAFIRVQNDLIDVSSTGNRLNRYKEYDRLAASIPEIDLAMTVFADEACIHGETKIATVFEGFKAINTLTKRKENFLVYCFDFKKGDFTIGWAYDARLVKNAMTIKIYLDDGNFFIVTPDHKILKRDGSWVCAEDLQHGDDLMPFYNLPVNGFLNKTRSNLFNRVWTLEKGWVSEKQLIDEWKLGEDIPKYEKFNTLSQLITIADVKRGQHIVKIDGQELKWQHIKDTLKSNGFNYAELKYLSKKKDRKRVLGKSNYRMVDVYDLSVEKYHNFCTDKVVMHNCQRDQDGKVFKVKCKNTEVKKELEHLYFSRDGLNLNQRDMWDKARRLFIKGDSFLEIVIDPDNPKDGIQNIMDLPADSMYRIETTKGKLIEFQQGKEGPDLQAVEKAPVASATDSELAQSNAVRFAPEQVVHTRIGDYRKLFYPYGVSLIEAARGPAHQLRQMEDMVMVNRLVRSPERKVFYIDIGQMPPYKAEAFMERLKDQFRKKKMTRNQNITSGASAVDEKFHAPAADEDIWVPVRQGSMTKIETLPGACLALDTKIPLLDGRILTLQEIINEFNDKKTIWVYSCNPKTGESAPGLVSWAGITRKNTKVVKVHLDNGESITCTPDHKFPVQGLGKVEAQNLKPGDSLFPFKMRQESIVKNRKTGLYTQIYDSKIRDWVFVHRMVSECVMGTKFFQTFIYNEIYKDLPKKVVHHIDFNKYNNVPENLAKMNWDDHKQYHKDHSDHTVAKISESQKKFHASLSKEERNIRYAKFTEAGDKIREKLKTDADFREFFLRRKKEGWEEFSKTEAYKKITKKNNDYWAVPDNKEKVFAKQTIVYPKNLFDLFMKLLSEGKLLEEIIPIVNSNRNVIQDYANANQHLKRKGIKLLEGLSVEHFKKMAKAYGYKGVKHARKESKNYNHKVVRVEYLDGKMDVGTLTIDGKHLVHNYHTFAVSPCGCYVYNSNLSEIDDTLYFRNKLFTALGFPKNYFALEDPNATRITLSAQNVEFARRVERLQSYLEDSLWTLADRHLKLLGVPEEAYEDLAIEMTRPSDWRELSRAEVWNNRINNANSLKGSQILPLYDILTKILQYQEDEASEIIARLKIEKLEDLKLQILAQNPMLLGVGIPGQGEQEMGTEPGGPNPMLGPQPGQEPSPMGQEAPPIGPEQMPPEQMGKEEPAPVQPYGEQAKPLPEVSIEDLEKYDLEIQDYEAEQDIEDIDYSEQM